MVTRYNGGELKIVATSCGESPVIEEIILELLAVQCITVAPKAECILTPVAGRFNCTHSYRKGASVSCRCGTVRDEPVI